MSRVLIEDTVLHSSGSPTFTVARSSLLMLVFVTVDGLEDQNPTPVWDSVGVNESLTQLVEASGTGQYVGVFAKWNPTPKTALLTGVAIGTSVHALCLSGCDPTTPYDTPPTPEQVGNGTTFAGLAVTSRPGDLIITCAGVNNTDVPNITPTSSLFTLGGFGSAGHSGVVAAWKGATSVTTNFSWPSANMATQAAVNVRALLGDDFPAHVSRYPHVPTGLARSDYK